MLGYEAAFTTGCLKALATDERHLLLGFLTTTIFLEGQRAFDTSCSSGSCKLSDGSKVLAPVWWPQPHFAFAGFLFEASVIYDTLPANKPPKAEMTCWSVFIGTPAAQQPALKQSIASSLRGAGVECRWALQARPSLGFKST